MLKQPTIAYLTDDAWAEVRIAHPDMRDLRDGIAGMLDAHAHWLCEGDARMAAGCMREIVRLANDLAELTKNQ